MPEPVAAPWRLWGVRMGRGERRTQDNFLVPGDRCGHSDIDFIVWVAARGDDVVVVDTGFGPESGRRRGRELDLGPGAAVELLGFRRSDVRAVVLTHLHFDHAGNLGDFPDARIVVQSAEMAYVTGSAMRHHRLSHFYEPGDVAELVHLLFAGRVDMVDGHHEVLPGIEVDLVGGHTRGSQVVAVDTGRGRVVLAGDAIHFAENLRDANPFPAMVDVEGVLDGFDTIRLLADSPAHIVPGHDPALFEQYPLLDPDAAGRIAVLHEPPLVPSQEDNQ
ncbi:N-acyl homoserine lactonase family protein [Nocardia flavorosea]|uniref:N-acyl homoserine lactonase family protein n=1 Tax=Nocardia flavorosea TaxID=53429 RepID=A0A846YN01_9NOCA|nr:N-acyl homoserine lactonase family protein [Nocardia flavorosea]NKY58980.1 N-acyl homoserine lactonase family protein [Nocardia flavorosea]